MPPKAKYTREEIFSVAFDLVRRGGMRELTARNLASALGTSARPIFTACGNLENVREAVLSRARGLYGEYVARGLRQTPSFKGAGEQYIRFAAEEPVLFRLLFMTQRDNPPPVGKALCAMDQYYDQILQSVIDAYDLAPEEGRRIYEHLGVYAHGYATMIATGMSQYDSDAISALLTDLFVSLLVRVKGERNHA